MTEFDNSSSTEADDSERERLVEEKSRETITANTVKKITSLSRNMTNKACQVNFGEVNNENYYRSGCQALQNKKMAEKIKFLREKINEKKIYDYNFIFIETMQP